MVLYVRRVLEHSEGNSDLRVGLIEFCSREGLLGVHQKSHNIPHQLVMGSSMSI